MTSYTSQTKLIREISTLNDEMIQILDRSWLHRNAFLFEKLTFQMQMVYLIIQASCEKNLAFKRVLLSFFRSMPLFCLNWKKIKILILNFWTFISVTYILWIDDFLWLSEENAWPHWRVVSFKGFPILKFPIIKL